MIVRALVAAPRIGRTSVRVTVGTSLPAPSCSEGSLECAAAAGAAGNTTLLLEAALALGVAGAVSTASSVAGLS